LLIAFLVMSPVCAFAASLTVMYCLGTPTTVTDIVCNGALKRQSCTGTWDIDGQSHTGPVIGPILPILGAGWPGFRVYGQTAYAGTRALVGLLSIVPPVYVVVSFVRARRLAQ